jgi:hypothetical protein
MIYFLYKLPSLYCIILNLLQINFSIFESQMFLGSVCAILGSVYDVRCVGCINTELERKMWMETV